MKIIPYVQYDGSWSIPDSYILECWNKMEELGLHKIVFYSGSVKNGFEFIEFLKAKENNAFFVFLGKEIACISWLNGIKHNHALAHYCCFPCSWGKHTKKIADELFKIWFDVKKQDGEPLFQIIIGQTPSTNKLAVRFLREMGMKKVGEIPHIAKDIYKGECSSMILSYKEREV